MLSDTIIYCLMMIPSISGQNYGKFYITDHYVLLESKSLVDSTPYNWLHDVRADTVHVLKQGEYEQIAAYPVEYVELREWVAVGSEVLGYHKVADTTYQGCDCIVLREDRRMPDPFSAGKSFTSSVYNIMCKVPEIEALPLSTRLRIPGYKEWVNEAYPMLMMQYDKEAPIPITETRFEHGVPFPRERVREWSGVEVGP